MFRAFGIFAIPFTHLTRKQYKYLNTCLKNFNSFFYKNKISKNISIYTSKKNHKIYKTLSFFTNFLITSNDFGYK